ncbi:TPA: hypothetical protein RZK50_001841, partial [Campylobacter coli]|nr:hypothetical protein [Campylobacter coli]
MVFHICYSSSSEYIKFVAVSMFNIVITACKGVEDENYKKHSLFCFHVFIEKDNLEANKLKDVAVALNKYYPCVVNLYTIKDEDIDIFSHCNLHQGARNAYYPLIMARYLAEKCEKFLYIGVDIMALQDIREIFNIDLKNNAIAAPLACRNYKGSMATYKSINSNIPDYTFSMEYRFCPDPMLVNIKEWLDQDIEKKCQYYIKNFHAISAFEGALNAVLQDNYLILEPKWGLWIGRQIGIEQEWLDDKFKGESNTPYWGYTREEYKKNLEDVKMWHFTHGCLKPWVSPYGFLKRQFLYCQAHQK